MRRPGPDWITPYDLPDEVKIREGVIGEHYYPEEGPEWYLVDKQCNWWVIAKADKRTPDYYVTAEAFSSRETDGITEVVSVRVRMDRDRKIKHPDIHAYAQGLMIRVRDRFRERHLD